MFEHLETPEQLFIFKLGSAMTMEKDSLHMLEDLESEAQRADLKTLFREHAGETRQQIANLEQCFSLLGQPVHESPSPTTKGLAKEGKATLRKADAGLADVVVLSGALETEHYETAVYEGLITSADALGQPAVAQLLRQNLDQEMAAIVKIQEAAKLVAGQPKGD